ncbi:hypothetical protein ACIQWR_15715 [Streptomyces sp. NPDC098789]
MFVIISFSITVVRTAEATNGERAPSREVINTAAARTAPAPAISAYGYEV